MTNFLGLLTMTTTINLTVIILTLLTPILSGAMEIRQEEFRYAMNAARDITGTTFVITVQPRSGRLAAAGCRSPMVHFQLGSAVVALSEAESLMSGLRICGITSNTPLVVTGHTCIIGPEQINRDLSLQRAGSVAGLLRDWGFTVADVRGKGSLAPVTTDPQQLYLNRRVEIAAVSQDYKVNPATQGR